MDGLTSSINQMKAQLEATKDETIRKTIQGNIDLVEAQLQKI